MLLVDVYHMDKAAVMEFQASQDGISIIIIIGTGIDSCNIDAHAVPYI